MTECVNTVAVNRFMTECVNTVAVDRFMTECVNTVAVNRFMTECVNTVAVNCYVDNINLINQALLQMFRNESFLFISWFKLSEDVCKPI